MSEHGFRKAYQLIAVDARFLLEALCPVSSSPANADLRTETIMPGVNRCAYHGREPRINQGLPAYDHKDTAASRQHLVLEGLFSFAVQAPCGTVDDRDVLTVPARLFQASEIDERGPLQEGGPVGVRPVNPFQKVGRKCDGCLHSHKMIIWPRGPFGRVADWLKSHESAQIAPETPRWGLLPRNGSLLPGDTPDIAISKSASPLQTFSDGLLEHGLVADSGLFGDLLCLFEVGDRNTN